MTWVHWQSNVGILFQKMNVFSPACDGILEANESKNYIVTLKLSKKGNDND
jgi:Cu+-exporting ATPase